MRRKIWAVARLKLLFQIIMLIAVVSLGILANTQYAAAQAIAIVDDGGANDAVGQNDLTRLKLDNGNPALLEIAWSWDEPSAITGGGQAVNACAMFDTDGDGNVNYSLCLEVSEDHDQNSPTFGQLVISKPPPPDGDTWFPHWIECSDAKDDRCTQPNRLGDPVDLPAGLGATTCSAMVAPTDPFDAAFPNGPGSDYPNDIEAACSIDTTLLPATYEFINVCSYPSAANDGNNNPFDCVVTPGSGFLTIIKVASPDNGTQFDFTLDPAASNGETTFSINGSGRIDRIPLLKSLGTGGAGLYSLLEAVPASWQLESVTCVTNGTSTGAASATFPAAGSTSAGQESIEIQPGQETICTFDNSQDALPDISVTKTANPSAVDEPGGDVTFTVLVENKSSSAVTLDSLEDDIYGDLTDISNEGGTAKPQLGTTCAVAQNLAASDGTTGSGPDVYSCTFDATVSGNAGESETDTVTATASNAAAPNGVSATDDATVTVADVASVLNIVKSTATPSLPEPGGTFSYQANITNPASNVDDIIVSRVDDTFGGSLTAAECGVAGFPVTLRPGDSMTCQFTVEHTGNLGDSWTNTVSATAIPLRLCRRKRNPKPGKRRDAACRPGPGGICLRS